MSIDSLALRRRRFPARREGVAQTNGLLAAGGDLSPERLVRAYRLGIFPWFSEGEPILWWSPDPRMVLFPRELKISRSLAKTLRKDLYQVRADTAFEQVIEACSEPRPHQAGTWITENMKQAYCACMPLGVAHSRGDLVPRATGWRPVRNGLGAHVLRRVHVLAHERRLQDRAGALVHRLEPGGSA